MATPIPGGGIFWPNHNITWSLVPDGAWFMGARTNLFALYDAAHPREAWVSEMQRAFDTWQASCGLTFEYLGIEEPNPATGFGWDQGVPGEVQGDPRFGDIRIAASPGCWPLDHTLFPGGGPAGGDITLNGTTACYIGSNPDLWSLMLHCIGISLNFAENQPVIPHIESVMNGPGPFTGLWPIDIQCSQKWYGLPPQSTQYPPPPGLANSANALRFSPESLNYFVAQEYERLLLRQASPSEITSWSNPMQPPLNWPERQVDGGLMGSPEYWNRCGANDIGWINQMFNDCLGRAPAPDEIAIWQQALRG